MISPTDTMREGLGVPTPPSNVEKVTNFLGSVKDTTVAATSSAANAIADEVAVRHDMASTKRKGKAKIRGALKTSRRVARDMAARAEDALADD